jgi:hypothetical protein
MPPRLGLLAETDELLLLCLTLSPSFMASLLAFSPPGSCCAPSHPTVADRCEPLLEQPHRGDLEAEQLADVGLGLDRRRLVGVAHLEGQTRPSPSSARRSFMTPGRRGRTGHAELLGHVAFASGAASAGHLHAGDQVSGRPHPAHARGARRARSAWLWQSPAPTYKPSSLQDVDAGARGARDGVDRVVGVIGTPPTPIPTFMWTGMVASSTQGFTRVQARATFQATDLPVLTLTAGPKMCAPALVGDRICLLVRPEAGEPHAVVLELAVHAEHELARHADLDAEVGVARADRSTAP